MKLLLNDKEIAHFLLSLIDHLTITKEKVEYYNINVNSVRNWAKAKRDLQNPKWRDKLKQKIKRAVEDDARSYYKRINAFLDPRKQEYYEKVHGNIELFIKHFGEENIFEAYKSHRKQNFVKSVGLRLESESTFIRRHKFKDYSQNCLIRNTVGNEELLVTKVDKSYPFWFIDSGYTNFLESNKVWHRLVQNHLHHGKLFEAPVDRLGNFKSFPKQWREDGEFIYVIEPGPFAAQIFHCDLKTWKYDVEKELRQYTDKKIKFREKAPKDERTNLYEELCNEDYYCIVSINSNAATEAIWAGVPAITLDRHVSNPVTVNKLSDVNNLFRGNLANWLTYLSYSQFTKQELLDGTAVEIVKKYHV
jgi:hypothetical protein